LTISPQRRRLGWYLHLHSDRSIRQAEVIAFLRDLLRHVHNPIFLIWDRLNAHRGKQVQEFLGRYRRLQTEFLPPYAPDLNPNEYGWSHLKCHSLANYAPEHLGELETATSAAVRRTRTQQPLLRGFVKAAGLPIRFR
jgi:transposase